MARRCGSFVFNSFQVSLACTLSLLVLLSYDHVQPTVCNFLCMCWQANLVQALCAALWVQFEPSFEKVASASRDQYLGGRAGAALLESKLQVSDHDF